MTKRRFLVLVRAGNRSLHRKWICADRNFDIFVSYYGPEKKPDVGPVEYFRAMGSTKWPAIHVHLEKDREVLGAYEAIWFPDDDICADASSINRMFQAFSSSALCLAQPALTHDSFWSHSFVLRNYQYDLRLTNFVEVMAPIFDQRALRLLQHTFVQSRSGWGLDYLWPLLLKENALGSAIGIIDETPVRHTRPIGAGDIYNGMTHGGEQDLAHLASLYPHVCFDSAIVTKRFRVSGGVKSRPRLGGLVASLWWRVSRLL